MPFDFKNQEEEHQEQQAPERPQPILHKPRGSAGSVKKIVMIVGILAVLGAAAFMANKMGFLGKKKTAPPVITELSPADTASKTVAQATVPSEQPPVKSEPVKPQPTTTTAKPTPPPAKPPATKAPEMKAPEKSAPKKSEPKKVEKPAPVIKAEPKKTAPPPPPKVTPPPPPAGGSEYTIFIGSFKQKSLADDEAGRWNQAGYQAFVTEKKGWHRVSLGKYSTKEEARQQAEKLKQAFESGFWIDHF